MIISSVPSKPLFSRTEIFSFQFVFNHFFLIICSAEDPISTIGAPRGHPKTAWYIWETVYPKSLILSIKGSRQGSCRRKWAVPAQGTGLLRLPVSPLNHTRKSTHLWRHFCLWSAVSVEMQQWRELKTFLNGQKPLQTEGCFLIPAAFQMPFLSFCRAQVFSLGNSQSLTLSGFPGCRKSLPPITLLPILALCPSTPPPFSSTALPTSSPGDDPWKPSAVCHRSDNYIPPLASCCLLLTSHPSSLLITPWHQSLWQGSSTGHVTCQPRNMTYRARLVDKGKGDRQHKSPVGIKETDGAFCRGLR